uniref:Uncharacterized protein n=1 Tax=Cacopsylla melanoneura TaxID=428564 RepID=A0A8D8YWB0_9HEMI
MEFRFVLFFALAVALVPSCKSVIVRLAYDLIRNNLIGPPEYFREQKWNFDPDVAKRRESDFAKRHGVHGEYTIERLGLGTDGYQELRREEQRIRDADVTTQLPHINGYYGGPSGPSYSPFSGSTPSYEEYRKR